MYKILQKVKEILQYKITYSSTLYKALLIGSFTMMLFIIMHIIQFKLVQSVLMEDIIYLICTTITFDLLHVFDDDQEPIAMPICIGIILAYIIFFIHYIQKFFI